MNSVCQLALLAALSAAPAIGAETIEAGPFSVDVTPELTLRYDGVTLIEGDRCVSFRGLKPGEPVLVDAAGGRVTQQDNIITVLAQKGRNTLRREVMVTPEAAHITFEMRVFGYTGGSHLQYDLLAPAKTWDGAAYEAWTGAPRGPLKKAAGTFSIGDSEPLEYLVRSVRYFTLRRPGVECSLDFNPDGAWVGESNYGDNAHTTPYHDGEQLHLLMLCAGGRFGGVFRGKVIVRPGAQPYEALHSTTPVAYTRGYPSSLALNFTPSGVEGDYEPVSTDVPAGKAYHWRNPKQVRVVQRPAGGLLYSDFAAAVDGEADGVLEIEQRPGLYLLTLNACDGEEDTGPFTVIGPEGPLLQDISIKAGEHWVKTVPLRVRDEKVALRFSGDWKIGALALQPILLEDEDFLFDRGFWNMEVGGSGPD